LISNEIAIFYPINKNKNNYIIILIIKVKKFS
jgi:hypothetical protein